MGKLTYHDIQSRERGVKIIEGAFDVGAVGAPTLKKPGFGFASIVRNGAGDYTVTLEEKFVGLVAADFLQLAAAGEDLTFQLLAEDVANGTFRLGCKAAAVLTDPSNGSTIYMSLRVKDTSVAY